MKAEEAYNIANHRPVRELDRLYTLLESKVCKKGKTHCKTVTKILITGEEA